MKRKLLVLSYLIIAAHIVGMRPGLAQAAAQAEPPTVQFDRSAAVVVEGEKRITVSVIVSAAPSQDATVTVSTRGGTATVGEDVTLNTDPASLSFAADEARPQSVGLTLQADDVQEGIEFIDLTLQSDDLSVGAVRSFRLWIRDDVLYPGQIASALTAQLQSDFEPATVFDAEAAADSLLGVVWRQAGRVEGAFTRTTASVSGEQGAAARAREEGFRAGSVWPVQRGEKRGETAHARRDLHALIPVQGRLQAKRQAALGRTLDDAAGAEALAGIPPRTELRGDLARAILYHHAMYPTSSSTDALAALTATLAQWMVEDPVDERELRRTTMIARYQGQPNPFVIAPELAEPAFNLRGTYPTPTVSFVQRGTVAAESDSVAGVDIVVEGVGEDAVTLSVALDAAASTVDPEDLGGFRYRTVQFPAGTPDGTVRRVRVPIVHDEVDEETERAVLTLQNASGFTRTGEVARYALDIENARQPTEEQGRVVLGPAFPNPVSPGRGAMVQFEISMEEAIPFSVEVFSTLGQRVRVRHYSAGEAARLSTIEINAQDLPSGLYIVRLRGPSVNITETFVIVR
ncbi:MAG: T9SS type A sorting domain-containing protein [Bacteroidetes bacterium]|jgi:hypothetical protein|nr:T9SS type A sorting domain-containing protein [Bacteroidota bacterium]